MLHKKESRKKLICRQFPKVCLLLPVLKKMTMSVCSFALMDIFDDFLFEGLPFFNETEHNIVTLLFPQCKMTHEMGV